MSSNSSMSIESVLQEERIFPPSSEMSSQSKIGSLDAYQGMVEKAKADPPISTEARNSINEKLKMVNELYPDKMKGLIEAYTKEFNVKKITPITLARQGEFLSHAISKIDDTL